MVITSLYFYWTCITVLFFNFNGTFYFSTGRRKERCHLGEETGAGLGLRTWAETGLCTHWDLADVNNLCYANEPKNQVSCLDQKPDLSGRSLKGVVRLETEKFVSSGLEQNRIFIRLAPGRQVTT